MKTRYDVTIVGSGFAGSILSRCLAARGRSVALLEKGRHPRFAVGESSTPLGAIALERLASRYGLEDLDSLAAYGRWTARHPELRRGLKRGFSFFAHRPGEMLRPDPSNRLLVAASPDDEVADAHWLRADVDAFLVDRARSEGVDYRSDFKLDGLDGGAGAVRVSGFQAGRRQQFETSFIVDASGPAAVVARRMGATDVEAPARFRSSVVFSHFSGVKALEEVWSEAGVAPQAGPYPDERAAVHHLVDEGWVYALPFDHDCVSAGLVADGEIEVSQARVIWQGLLDRYPTLAQQFENATELRALEARSPLQHRLDRASGARWAALPHVYAFFDPMFSTGIAWSLVGVERLAEILVGAEATAVEDLTRYGRQTSAEADQIERLIYGASIARRGGDGADFDVFVAQSLLYFALVSYEEVRQRVFDATDQEVTGFLGAGDPWAEKVLEESVGRLEEWRDLGGDVGPSDELAERFTRWVTDSIAPRNVAGFADSDRQNLYPVDLDLLVERSGLLGLERGEMRELLPRLRGRRRAPSGIS